MDLRFLTTFIQVAELSSFSRAAEKLGYSQPTVSVQIRQLEEELGCRLFDRIGHAVRLTDKGRDLLTHAQQICRMCDEMTTGSADPGSIGGTVRLALADSLCTPLISRVFPVLRSQFPNVSLRLTTAGTEDLFRLLDQNQVDLVCTLDSHIYSSDYIVAHEARIGVHVILPANHPLAGKDHLSCEDLLTQDLLLTEKNMSYRRVLDQWLAARSLRAEPVLELGSADLLCSLVERGMGLSFLPDYVTEDAVQRGTVVRRGVQDFESDIWQQLLYHRDKWISRPMEAVIGLLSDISL